MRKTVSVFLVLLIIISAPFVFASETVEEVDVEYSVTIQEQLMSINDTTSLSPSAYKTAFLRLTNTDDVTTIQAICELFVSSYFASRRFENYDFGYFVSKDSLTDPTIAYLTSHAAYQREVNDILDFNIVSDSIEFHDFSATVAGDICNAQIAVEYSYQLTGAFNEVCYQNCVFYLTLRESSDYWLVTSCTTSMPEEQVDSFEYAAFDAKASAMAVTSVIVEDQLDVAENVSISPHAATLQGTAYSVADAISYAAKYYNKTNSLFGASTANCQNFASQCVWAGLLDGINATGSSQTALPAISVAYAGTQESSNIWCRNQQSTYYKTSDGYSYGSNWAWDNVDGFLQLIEASNHTKPGPQGQYILGLSRACAGDVISWDTSKTRDLKSGTYDHAMFVTKVTGSVGSRGVGNIFIAANTSATTSAYMPLANYCSYTADYFATAHITEGYYYIDPSIDINSSSQVQ